MSLRTRVRSLFPGAVPAALTEIALIFVGITLAISFENWNSERAERESEQASLRELRSDLVDNIEELKADLAFDSLTLVGFDTILLHLEARLPYTDDLAATFAYLENWESPYLTISAYETLKTRGLDLVTDAALRAEIVRLFENVYRKLIEDYDRSEWINFEVSMYPLMLSHIEERPGSVAEPIDYEALMDDRPFRIALLRSASLRTGGVSLKEEAIRSTQIVINMIDMSLRN